MVKDVCILRNISVHQRDNDPGSGVAAFRLVCYFEAQNQNSYGK